MNNAIDKRSRKETPVLVDFWAEWCRPCRALAPVVEAIAEQYNDRARVFKLNVDDSPTIAQRYGIQGIPTLILFQNGVEKQRIGGVASQERISRTIDRYTRGPPPRSQKRRKRGWRICEHDRRNRWVSLNGKLRSLLVSMAALALRQRSSGRSAYVFITGRREPELARAVKEIGRNVTGVQGDVANLGDLDRLFAQIKREKGKLDSVFGNAGVVKYAPFGSITEEHYDSIFSINVKGLLFTVQKALPLLPDGASIILNASIVASKGFSRNSVYNATKAARSFVRTWTTDLKERCIRVNTVSPGSIDTPGLSTYCLPQKSANNKRN